jgi:hypothetical protein
LRENQVNRYLRSVQLGQTERGSYTLVIALPGSHDDDESGTRVAHELDVRIRRIATKLSEFGERERPADWDDFDKAYCRALAPLGDSQVLVGLTVSLQEAEEHSSPTWFGIAELRHARDAALELDDRPTVSEAGVLVPPLEAVEIIHENLTLVGDVTRLSRPEVSIRGEILGRIRTLRARLVPDAYQVAIQAHAAERPVRVIGDVVERHGSFRFLDVFSLEFSE